MGKLKGYRMASLYIHPELYERVRCTAYTLNELIYEFVAEALASAIKRRLSRSQQRVMIAMAKQNIANVARRNAASSGKRKTGHKHNPVL